MPSQRRLLVVTESLGVGGTESHLIRLLPELAKQGWAVAVYCLTERGSRADRVEAQGVEVFAADTPQGGNRLLSRLPASGTLYRLMRRWRPDIAHFYLPGPYLIGAPLAIAARVPVKVMSRRSLSRYQRKWPAVARIEQVLHRHMDAVTGNSRAVVDELIAEGIPEGKVRVIYNGIDATAPSSDRKDMREWFGIADDTVAGVMVANLIPYKGHRDLIEGLAQVAGKLEHWCVLFAGLDRSPSGGRSFRAELEALAEERGIGANVRFLGQRSDISRLLTAADFGLLTSHHEGFANVIIEGMAAGLPMIVTAAGGNPEAVVDKKTGLVVPVGDTKAIGKAVLRLASDADLRRRLGEAGKARVKKEFSIENCVAAHVELYDELLGRLSTAANP